MGFGGDDEFGFGFDFIDSFEGVSGGEHGNVENGQLAQSCLGGLTVLSLRQLFGRRRTQFIGRSEGEL